MKKYTILLLLSFICFAASAQLHKVSIYCYLDDGGETTYQNYEKLYPDSVVKAVTINYRKEHNLKNGYEALLWMNQDGWKLVSTIAGSFFLSRDIWLNDAAMKLYLDNLKYLHEKRP